MQFAPVQMLVVAFDGNRFRGEIWPELERLKREGVVRILDLMLVRKDSAGAVSHMVASDLDWEEASAFGETMGMLAGFARDGLPGLERGAIAGMAEMMDGHLFDEEDAFKLEQLLPNETTAAVVLIEHLWAKPLLAAVLVRTASRCSTIGSSRRRSWRRAEGSPPSPPRTAVKNDHPIWMMASRTPAGHLSTMACAPSAL